MGTYLSSHRAVRWRKDRDRTPRLFGCGAERLRYIIYYVSTLSMSQYLHRRQNSSVGVGPVGHVFTERSFYRWLGGVCGRSVTQPTEGVDLDATLGDFGLRANGPAGIEIGRVEPTLGSPPFLVWLATAGRLGHGGTPTAGELRTLHRGIMDDQNAQVRADLAFFPTANGGAGFSTGSIAWVCALSHAGCRNNVTQVTGNVLRRFLDSTPL
jgi:N,N-dimethylformamidase